MTEPAVAGRALGSRYTLVDRIGRGASGEVWRAHDRQTGNDVAAKLLWPQHAADPEILARFVQERSVLLGLDHPQVVRVHDFVVEGSDLAIVMDLVDGPDVGTVLAQQGTLPSATAVPLAAAVLDALDSAHRCGVVHRDVKPDNVMLARQPHAGSPRAADVRLADFGIAGIVQDEAAPATELIGTPSYMPPELVSFGKFGPASDVYAAGVVLYEMLGGRTPFGGPGTHLALATRHVDAAPPRLPVADVLWGVLDLLLSKDPSTRPGAAEAAGLLRALPPSSLEDAPLAVQPQPGSWERSRSALPGKRAVEAALGGPGPLRDRPGPAAPEAADSTEATSLRAARPTTRPALVAREQEHADGSGATMMRATAPDAPAVPRRPAPARMRAGTRVLVGAAVAAVLGGGGALLWTSGALRPEQTEPEVEITTTAAHRSGSHLPTGLRVDLDASYDAGEQVTRLRATLSAAPNAPLRGDVLLATPGLARDCAAVEEQEGVVRQIRASGDGFELPCGIRLLDVDLAGGATRTVDLTVGLDLVNADGEVPDDYGAWLEAVQQATDAGLAAVPGTAFALQRVAGLRTEPTPVTLTGSATPVPYRVTATWAGAGEEAATELFTPDTSDGMETELLRQLTGGAGLDGVRLSACNAAQVIGIRVLAEQPDASCHVRAVVGALDSGEAAFAIRMR